jgi:adenosylcobinamide-GDP ribazoletransferase
MTKLAAGMYRLAADLKIGVSFCTRLPLGSMAANEGNCIARASWAMPIAGALVGLTGASVYWLGDRLRVAPQCAAMLAVAATVLATGALHEDGLADTFDGFGGGKTRERKLEIMRDSRIGTYGVCALAVSLILRWSALSVITVPLPVAIALVAAHASARATLPVFMRLVPPARTDGLSAQAGQPPWACVAAASLLGALALLAGFGPTAAMICLLLLSSAGLFLAWLTLTQIGGQTGDVLGALEQMGEILILLTAAALFQTQLLP